MFRLEKVRKARKNAERVHLHQDQARNDRKKASDCKEVSTARPPVRLEMEPAFTRKGGVTDAGYRVRLGGSLPLELSIRGRCLLRDRTGSRKGRGRTAFAERAQRAVRNARPPGHRDQGEQGQASGTALVTHSHKHHTNRFD